MVLGLASVCSKILSCGFRENGNFGDAGNKGHASFPRRKKKKQKQKEELSSVSCLLGMGKI